MISAIEYALGWRRERWLDEMEIGGEKVIVPMFPLRRPEKEIGSARRLRISSWREHG